MLKIAKFSYSLLFNNIPSTVPCVLKKYYKKWEDCFLGYSPAMHEHNIDSIAVAMWWYELL